MDCLIAPAYWNQFQDIYQKQDLWNNLRFLFGCVVTAGTALNILFYPVPLMAIHFVQGSTLVESRSFTDLDNPYDLGVKNNVCQVMGAPDYLGLSWLLPLEYRQY